MRRYNETGPDGLYTFFALACGVTWVAAAPTAITWLQGDQPSGAAIAGAGLSAFGPLIAAVLVAARRGQARGVFGPWRTSPTWILLALGVPLGIRTSSVALYALLGGTPEQWFYPPSTPEAVAALFFFPVGEEFGWRGFAYPRAVARWGVVRGALWVGAVWGLWHLAYSVTPQTGGFDAFLFVQGMLELPAYALILAWVFERSGRSMAVAIVFHATAHLDHIELAPREHLGLHAVHLLLVVVAALAAGLSLARGRSPASPTSADLEGGEHTAAGE